MSTPLLLLLVGLAFAVFIGGLSLLRREPLSAQFALETMFITVIVSGLAALTGLSADPIFFILFLVVLYLVTMRVRLLVDLGNLFARRKNFKFAERLYAATLRLWPDANARFLVQLNQGVSSLQQGALDDAIALFKELLLHADQGKIGVKVEAALHYNLGIAYRRKDLEPQAVSEFNQVVDTWPLSESARRANAALSYGRHKSKPPSSEEDMPGE